jgi:hypothetical protein
MRQERARIIGYRWSDRTPIRARSRGGFLELGATTETACSGCRCWHERGRAHKGSVTDWNAERLALLPHAPLSSGLELLLDDIGNLPRTFTFTERASAAIVRRDPSVPVVWITQPEIADETDSVLYLAPRGTRATLKCGVALHITSAGRTSVAGPTEIVADEGPFVLAAETGLWLANIQVPKDAETEAKFMAFGRTVVRDLERPQKGRKQR